MEISPSKRGRGRPRKPAEEGKRHTLTIRLGVDMRNQVELAANRQGSSLAQEVEARLAQSFEIDQVLGPKEHAKFLRLVAASSDFFGQFLQHLAAVKNAIETRTSGSFENDPATFWAVRKGMLDLVDRMMPDEPAWVAAQQLAADDPALEYYVDERPAWEEMGIEVARAICPIPRRYPGLVPPKNADKTG